MAFIFYGRDMDQSLCACSRTHVASLQRSTLHISNWKILSFLLLLVLVFLAFQLLFVLFDFLVALTKMGEKTKECSTCDWVGSGWV